MATAVRETVDGDTEKLEDLLNRVIGEYQEETVSWAKLLGFFSKRGKYEGYMDINVSPRKIKKVVEESE